MVDDDLDFLGQSNDIASEMAAQLENVRGELASWAAAALLNRRPQARVYRGNKGQALCRQDMDFHLRHLHSALARGAEVLIDYQTWVTAMFAQRGVDPGEICKGVAVLAEGLHRYLPEPAASEAARLLLGAFEQGAQ